MYFNPIHCQIGNYCWDENSLEQYCYTFKDNNKFHFIHRMSVAIEEGIGTYKIKDDTLKFIYEEMPFFKQEQIIKKTNEYETAIVLRIKAIDFDTNEEIDNIKVRTYNSQDYLNKIITQNDNAFRILTLIDKEVKINFDKGISYFMISENGFSQFGFKIDQPGVYDVKVYLAKDRLTTEYVMKSDEEIYRILLNSDSLIIIEDLDGSYQIPLKKME